MKVYVGGNRAFLDHIQHIMNRIKRLGYEITHDWTQTTKIADRHVRDQATKCFEGIKEADLVVILMTSPSHKHHSCFAELGIAIGLQKEIVIVGMELLPPRTEQVFWFSERVRHIDDEQGLFDMFNENESRLE